MTMFGDSRKSRAALIIGNSNYQNVGILADPRNDALAMRDMVQELGFALHYGVDLGKQAMQESIAAFETLLVRMRAEVGLVYYSGHGLQVDGVNYCVPIDTDAAAANPVDQLIPLENLILSMGDTVKTRLIILDACRNNPFAKPIADSYARGKGLTASGIEPLKGLAEIKAPPDTFIAFAAGPGDVAYEGWKGEGYSTFTHALLRHIDATDLSLDNLMVRVGKEVERNTDGKQVSWSHSSLRSTFFFNPGSLILLIGNAIGLLAFLVSLTPYSFALVSNEEPVWVGAAVGVAIATFILFLVGLQRAYAHGRSGREDDDGGDPENLRFRIPWQRGLFGGFFGGLIAGPIIAVTYRYAVDWSAEPGVHPTIGRLLTDITIGSTIVGLFLGILSLTVAQYFVSIRERSALAAWSQPLLTVVTGAILGGVLAGVITGPIETAYYHALPSRPNLRPEIMLIGAVPGAAIVVFSIVNYSLDRVSLRALLESGRTTLLATIAVVILSALPLYGLNEFISTNIRDRLATGGVGNVLLAGLTYGVIVGAILGSVIGLTLYWTRDRIRP